MEIGIILAVDFFILLLILANIPLYLQLCYRRNASDDYIVVTVYAVYRLLHYSMKIPALQLEKEGKVWPTGAGICKAIYRKICVASRAVAACSGGDQGTLYCLPPVNECLDRQADLCTLSLANPLRNGGRGACRNFVWRNLEWQEFAVKAAWTKGGFFRQTYCGFDPCPGGKPVGN